MKKRSQNVSGPPANDNGQCVITGPGKPVSLADATNVLLEAGIIENFKIHLSQGELFPTTPEEIANELEGFLGYYISGR